FAKFCPCPGTYEKHPTELLLKNFNAINLFKVLKEYCPPIDDQLVFCQLFGNPLNCSHLFSQELPHRLLIRDPRRHPPRNVTIVRQPMLVEPPCRMVSDYCTRYLSSLGPVYNP
uniref:Uncharacterized protein n=1 Tax=Romanomermis culicivorax TaxID=13658 RepID=A0A915IDY2_ROMCU